MLSPTQIVKFLDERCWQEALVGVYQILDKRFRDDPRAQKMLQRDLADSDPGYFELNARDIGIGGEKKPG
jgi:hypothetical protein